MPTRSAVIPGRVPGASIDVSSAVIHGPRSPSIAHRVDFIEGVTIVRPMFITSTKFAIFLSV